MIFIHNRTKSATPDKYLLDPAFEFVHLFFEFKVLNTGGARMAIRNDASLGPENFHVGSTEEVKSLLGKEKA